MISVLSDHIETPLGTMLLLARDGAMIGLEFDDHPERVARDLRLRYGSSELFPADNPMGFRTASAPISPATSRPSRAFPPMAAARNSSAGCGTSSSAFPAVSRFPTANWPTRLGDKNAMRAVGLANGRNPISIVVPCHRVIGADGSLTGYGGGVQAQGMAAET